MAFWERHADAQEPMEAWFGIVREGRWDSPADVMAAFPYVSVLEKRRLVFNISGNKYRVVVKVHYKTKTVFIRFVGTHAEYDRIDANEV